MSENASSVGFMHILICILYEFSTIFYFLRKIKIN